MTGQFQQFDIVAATDGNPRKASGRVQKVLELTQEEWERRDFCWVTGCGCMRGAQPCLRTRPTGPGTWVYVIWDGYPGPYAERAENLVRIMNH